MSVLTCIIESNSLFKESSDNPIKEVIFISSQDEDHQNHNLNSDLNESLYTYCYAAAYYLLYCHNTYHFSYEPKTKSNLSEFENYYKLNSWNEDIFKLIDSDTTIGLIAKELFETQSITSYAIKFKSYFNLSTKSTIELQNKPLRIDHHNECRLLNTYTSSVKYITYYFIILQLMIMYNNSQRDYNLNINNSIDHFNKILQNFMNRCTKEDIYNVLSALF